MSPSSREPHPLRLKIDLSDLALAFDTGGQEGRFYLDRDTGRVILLTEDTRREYKRVSAAMGPVEANGQAAAFEAALQAAELHDWEVELVRDAALVAAGPKKRFLKVPEADLHDGYRDMEDFIDTVKNARLAERLARAIGGRGAFRAFKDVLLNQPAERERWFAFQTARQRERVLAWLEAEGIEAEDAASNGG